jgi:hypothetical protein
MDSVSKEILRILRKIRRRIYISITINYAILGLVFGLSAAVLLSIVSRLYPVYNTYFWIFIIAGAGVLLALLCSLFKIPSYRTAALRADKLGLNERTVTAVELMEDDSSIALLQKKDALSAIRSLNYKDGIKIVPNLKQLLIVLPLVIALIVMSYIPNPLDEIAKQRYELAQVKKEEIKKVEKTEKEIEKNSKLSELEKKEIENKLEELKKEIKLSSNEKEVNKSLQRAEKKLDLVKEKYEDKELKAISNALAKSDITRPLADLIKKGDSEEVKKAMKDLAKNLKSMDKDKAKELADSMSKLAEELKENKELKNSIANLASKMSKGELGDLSKEMSEISGEISELMEDENFKDAVAQVQKSLNEGQNGQQAQDNGDDGTLGLSGQGQGQGNQNGQGAGNGGQGSGGGGSGAGSGTGMNDGGPTGEASPNFGLNKKDGSIKKNGEYEKIFNPKNLGGDSDKSTITGSKNNSGNSERVNTEKGINIRGDSVPYNQVVGEYKSRAFEGLDKSDIPEGMRDIVKSYFTSLED